MRHYVNSCYYVNQSLGQWLHNFAHLFIDFRDWSSWSPVTEKLTGDITQRLSNAKTSTELTGVPQEYLVTSSVTGPVTQKCALTFPFIFFIFFLWTLGNGQMNIIHNHHTKNKIDTKTSIILNPMQSLAKSQSNFTFFFLLKFMLHHYINWIWTHFLILVISFPLIFYCKCVLLLIL